MWSRNLENTINRLFSSIDRNQFDNSFTEWVNSIFQIVKGQVIVNEKSNEITAIPLLIESLMIDDCIITIDAIGT